MIDLTKMLFVVDGDTEILSLTQKLQKEYKSIPAFRKSRCNGRDVSVHGYVNGISGILSIALDSCFLKIICILDKEKRNISSATLAKNIKREIISRFSGKYAASELENKIVVFVPDTCFENWIVADIESIKADDLINDDAVQQYYDGKSGVFVLSTIMKSKYNKLIHAPRFFKKVSFGVAERYSPSFSSFKKLIT